MAGGTFSIKNSICDIAHAYRKHEHVLKLQAFNGEECLMRASSHDGMMRWIDAIQTNSNLDLDATPSFNLIKRKAEQASSRPGSFSNISPIRFVIIVIIVIVATVTIGPVEAFV